VIKSVAPTNFEMKKGAGKSDLQNLNGPNNETIGMLNKDCDFNSDQQRFEILTNGINVLRNKKQKIAAIT
jgi:hypothetical protein